MSSEPLQDLTKPRSNTSGVTWRKSVAEQEDIVNGTHQIHDDRTHGFFAKGRELESVGDAHTCVRPPRTRATRQTHHL